jgi:uncharacterized membrane protein YkvA (DUF1232 family)
MIQNTFFTTALQKAALLAGKPGRLLLLLSRLAVKLRTINWTKISRGDVKEKIFVIGRLIKAYAQGKYTKIPWKTALILIAAIIYFVNPLDLVPDLIPVAGLADDFGILLWVYNSLNHEIDKFLSWEQSQLTA